MLTYFLTTTLTTVGLGDLKPISNFERIIGSILMLVGNIMFSVIFSQAAQSLNKTIMINQPFNEARADLEKFFEVLKRFNSNTPVDPKFRSQIEAFFEYTWRKDPT